MTGVERCYRYCKDVESGKILTNRWIKLAVKRFRNDLNRSKSKDWPYRFDEEKANRFIQFAELLKQYKDEFRGKPLVLEDWQCFIFANIYGWVNKETGYRRFRKAFVFVARKNGKSHMMAATLLYDILTTNGAECYCAATKKEQSKIVFSVVKEMVKQNQGLKDRLRLYNSTSRITNDRTAGFIEALSSESDKMDGLNPSCVVVDEVAAMKNYDIIKVLASGMGSRKEALLFEITSGSDDMYSAGKQEFDRSRQILQGIEDDESYFCVLYCIDDKDDWRKPEFDFKANPNLGVSISAEWLAKQRAEAMQVPSLEGEFRVKNLGQFITPITAWLQPSVWQVCIDNAKKFSPDPKKPYYAIGGVDLSKRNDLTAFTVCVYQDERYYLIHKAYFPLNMMAEKLKTDNELWRHWAEKGVVTGTSGSTIDYKVMYKDIAEINDRFHLECILFDPYNSNALIEKLQDDFELVEVQQNLKNMSPFIKSFEECIRKGDVVDDNPLMQWEMSHAEVYRDANENLKLQKPDSQKSGKRIDHCVTSSMTVGYIKAQLDAGEIDLRSTEESVKQLEAFLSSLKWG